MSVVVTDPPKRGPYRYLDYFQEEDRASFAGREEDVAEVSARASAEEPFVLYGRSGLGKTSLLLAGVFPALRQRELRPVHIRVTATPLADLRTAIANDLQQSESGDLAAALRDASKASGLVLIFDQFEEFFISTRNQPAARREFIQLVSTLFNDPHIDIHLTFSLREEYLADLDDFRDAFPTLMSNQYRLRPLTAFGARQAIVAPLVHAGIPFDQALVVKLVDLLAEVDFDPVLLQIACGEVYREAISQSAQGDVHLTEEHLKRIGGIQGLFARYLNNAIRRVPEGQVLLSRAVLDALITEEETKRAVTFEALLTNDDFKASKEEVEAVLEALLAQKLIRRDLRGGKLWIELSHDRLAPSVVKWFKTDKDFSQFRDARDLIANAARRASFPDRLETLLSAAQIEKLVTPYRERLKLTEQQRAFMFWSAMCGQLEDVKYWAERFGDRPAEEALLTLIRHSSPDARLAAAATAARLMDARPDITDACLDAAMGDSSPEVRQAAARALAGRAGAAEIGAIETALSRRATRGRALDVLAAFVKFGGPLEQFPWFWRLLARRRAGEAARQHFRDQIKARSRRGALVGLVAAVAWSATIGLFIACIANWADATIPWIVTALSYTGMWAGGLVSTGVILGWWLGRRGAVRAAITGHEGRWLLAPFGRGLLVTVVVTLIIAGLMFIGADAESALGFVVIAGVLVAAAVFLAGYLWIIRPIVWPAATTRERVLWTFAVGFAGFSLSFVPSLYDGSEAWLLLFVSGTVWALTTMATLVLTETAVAQPIGSITAPRWGRRIGRPLTVLAVAAFPFLFVGSLGLDSVPFLARRTTVTDQNGELDLPLRARMLDSIYFTVDAREWTSPWTVMDVPLGASIWLLDPSLGWSPVGGADHLLFLPPGRHRLSARGFTDTEEPRKLDFTALPVFKGAGAEIALSKDEPTPVVLELSPENKQGNRHVWRASTVVRISGPGLPGETLKVRLPSSGHDTKGRLFQQVASERQSFEYALPRALETGGRLSYVQQAPELKPVPIDAATRTFTLSLTYELPDDDPDTALAPLRRRDDDVTRPIYVPLFLSLNAPDVLQLFDAETTSDVLDKIRKSTFWNDGTQLPVLRDRFDAAARGDVALALSRRYVELKPDDADAINDLAWRLVKRDEAPEALALAKQAAALSKNANPFILDTLAHAALIAGHEREALAAWEAALKVQPKYFDGELDQYCKGDPALLNQLRAKFGQTRSN